MAAIASNSVDDTPSAAVAVSRAIKLSLYASVIGSITDESALPVLVLFMSTPEPIPSHPESSVAVTIYVEASICPALIWSTVVALNFIPASNNLVVESFQKPLVSFST